MSLGQRLIELRKEKHLSQEEVAEKLNVTRQTISKWETDQSMPDFDKILPLCELFEISTDELLTGRKEQLERQKEEIIDTRENKKKRTIGLVTGIMLYFLSIVWILLSVTALDKKPEIIVAIFMLICGIATCIIIYSSIMYKKEKTELEEKEDKQYKQIENIISIITVIIYLLISFTTMAWHITWIIWIIYALVMEIVKLILSLRGDKNEQ